VQDFLTGVPEKWGQSAVPKPIPLPTCMLNHLRIDEAVNHRSVDGLCYGRGCSQFAGDLPINPRSGNYIL